MRLRDRIAMWAGAAALAAAVFAVGGAPFWALLLVVGCTVVAVGALVPSRRRPARLSPLVLLLGAAAGLTALQLVPLPPQVLAALNPVAHDLIRDGRALAGDDRTWMALSVDPGSTRRELLELACYVAIGWVAVRFAATEGGRTRLLSAVALTCGAAAIIAGVHHLVGASALYGVYAPRQASPTVMAPLLNSNHFACLLAVGAAVSAGLAFDSRGSSRVRVFWLACMLVDVAIGLLTQSRGGVAALAAATIVTLVIVALQRRTEPSERRRPHALRVTLPAGIVLFCTLMLVVYLSAAGVGRELETTRLDEISDSRSKYAVWRSSLELIAESPWVGVGRGGFEPALTRLHPASAYHTFSHVENEYLQAVVDWGLVGGGVLALILAALVLAAVRHWRDGPLAAGAFGASAAVAAQSAVDFGLELPGLAVPMIVVVATLTWAPMYKSRSPRLPITMRAVGLAVLVAIAGWSLLPAGRTLAEDQARLAAMDPRSLAAARQAMARHPLDYVAPTHAAAAMRAQPAEAIEYMNRALTLHPTHPDLHRIVGRMLVKAGKPGQARVEYALAMEGTRLPDEVVLEILRAFPDATAAAAALPPEHRAMERIVKLLGVQKRSDVALRYLERVVEAAPLDAHAWHMLLEVADRVGDRETAERAARRRVAIDPGLGARARLGKVLFDRGKLTEAEQALAGLAQSGGATGEQVSAQLLLCDVYIGQQKWQPARDCLHKLRDAPALRDQTRRHVHIRLGKVEDALGNPRRAEFERAQAGRGN